MNSRKFKGVIVHGEKSPLDMGAFEQAIQNLYHIVDKEYIVVSSTFYAFDLSQWFISVTDDTNRDLNQIFSLGPLEGHPYSGLYGPKPIVYISLDSDGRLYADYTTSLDNIFGWYIILPLYFNNGGDNTELTITFKDWKFKI